MTKHEDLLPEEIKPDNDKFMMLAKTSQTLLENITLLPIQRDE